MSAKPTASVKIQWNKLTPRERDAAVAEHVMGWTRHARKCWHPTDNRLIAGVLFCAPGFPNFDGGSAGGINTPPCFATDHNAAAMVKEKFEHWTLRTSFTPALICRAYIMRIDEHGWLVVYAEAKALTEPEAICIAALRAKGIEVEV